MKRIYPNEEARQRERWLQLYVEGLDEGNLAQVGEVLEAALTDAELERSLHEINLAYAEELGLAEWAGEAATVRQLAREHLPSAFAQETPAKALTIGDVAQQLAARQSVAPDDEAAQRALLENPRPLPEWLSLHEIRRLADELKITASSRFWRIFHETAMALRAGRSHHQAMLAARRKRSAKQTEKTDERCQETKN